MKICSKCDRSDTKFPKQGTKCQACLNKMGYEQKKRKFEVIRSYIVAQKDNPCMDCGVNYPSYVMDFDHRPSEYKLFNISRYMRANKSLQQVVEEIAKCDLVCSNCHRIRTFTRLEENSMI